MTESTVLYEERGAVALATLNRPQALNSFTRQMHRDLGAAMDRVEANPANQPFAMATMSFQKYKTTANSVPICDTVRPSPACMPISLNRLM